LRQLGFLLEMVYLRWDTIHYISMNIVNIMNIMNIMIFILM